MSGKSLSDRINGARRQFAARRAVLLRKHEETMSKVVYKPRNDFVVFRAAKYGKVGKVVMPDVATDDERYYVVAAGPDVKGLEEGDEVLVMVKEGTCTRLPGTRDLLLSREVNVALVIERPEGE